MELNQSILLQKQVKDNAENLQSEFLDMKYWEEAMKLKERKLLNERDEPQTLPPIRNKKKHTTKESEEAYNNLGKKDQCNDSSESLFKVNQYLQIQKDHEKATEYKEEGNRFVQQKEWDKAIVSYSKAIEVFPYDAVFYANRALCYLKQDNLHLAHEDCSSAIEMNDTYVKAYHRRGTARMGLKQYEEAKQDIQKILLLEPSNKEAKALLNQVNKQLEHSKPVIKSGEDITDDILVEKKIAKKILGDVKSNKKIIGNKVDSNKENDMKSTVEPTTGSVTRQKGNSRIPDWLPEKDNVKIVELVGKPPHLRSKEPFKKVPVQEADLSKPFKEEIETCIAKDVLKTKDVELSDVSSNDTTKCLESVTKIEPESKKNFTENYTEVPPVPKTAVQFVINWRKYTSSDIRYSYLRQLQPGSLPKIFKDSLESSIFSDILTILKTEFVNRQEPVFSYLKDLSNVKRFKALVMFISNSEKQDLKFMFSYCKTHEKISEEELAEMQNKYEI
ncbi:PREDICTED: RNA polymerase II-associated protein 3 [Dinoponera quadriceps]|uniref:RNA polymerase II-associated protein 3 n=1 Tax=Dinoponera quadriceps TaxID=609295 RepID=A0A6P3YAS0_DINQU|nr:PREDICTED: RNA polymerase II-associated protein 3 [Dinoponera quadriceps]XP_014488080.1 PREDICTED: RNA polymerase II-associated protein 3 [Dinoponera quadriceps]XP_014488086.1 PREDICTED: RNA polymerase II-associated protein 3 [Dinoponera quadriceps]XP_014488093.1 PREDICTED: RNA polymerase II-associated protein 3 [Dinoponera quadriceps]XP_014488101.1 PREDICTED: RNA polymerase II-associated protein 3 [Dinoponera quadriceps]XP_014488109.1 PREDICTED: RNA polymerase II-associated protein 3 [Dino